MSDTAEIDFSELIERVAIHLFGPPNPKHSKPGNPRWGTSGSLSIDTAKGTFYDHEIKVGGGVVDLIRRHGHDKPVEWLKSQGLIHVNGNGGTKWNGAKAKSKAAKPAPKKPLRTTGEFPGLGPPVKIYRYEESDLEVCRFEPKDFRQRRADSSDPGWYIWNTDGCAIVPYNLSALRKAIEADEWVHFVEGEKDVETALTIGITATCNPMGACKWTDGFEEHFRGARVCIIPDNDKSGRDHRDLYAAKLAPVAKKLVALELPGLPDKGDLSDFVAAYDSPQAALEAFQNVFKDQAKEWQAPADEPHQDAANDQDSVLSEHDCAIAFIDRHKDVLRYCHGGADGWFIWDGQRWRQDTTRRAFDMLRETIQFIAATGSSRDRKSAGRASFCTGAETYARALSLVAVEPNAFDQDDWLLGTPGGTCDLRTGELHPAHPDEMISKLTAVAPAPPGTPCPLWFKFLAEASGGDADLVAFLQRFCGYALTGSTREQKLSFVIGTGKNGKSVYVKTVQKVFGEYATVAAMSTFTAQTLESHPEEIASLAGARLVIANETKEGTRWDEVRVKSLTAGDPIRARFMRQNSFVFQPQFKLLFLGNTAPEITTLDAAMRRRFLMVPFNIVPAKEDQELEQKLKAEWPAILRWMVDGCLAWQCEGLRPPASVQEATSTYLDEQDLFADWLRECCDVDPGNIYKKTSVSALYASWCEYAKKFGRRPASKQSFGMAMPRHGFKSKQIKEFNGKGYEGIQLRPLDMPWGDR